MGGKGEGEGEGEGEGGSISLEVEWKRSYVVIVKKAPKSCRSRLHLEQGMLCSLSSALVTSRVVSMIDDGSLLGATSSAVDGLARW